MRSQSMAGRAGVDATREDGRAEEEDEDVEGREDGVAATRPRHCLWWVQTSEADAEVFESEKQGKAGEVVI